MLLCSELKHEDVTCLTEDWKNVQKINYTNIVEFRLESAFCSSSEHGVSGIYVDGLKTKEISYFAGISGEKIFEMSLIELP